MKPESLWPMFFTAGPRRKLRERAALPPLHSGPEGGRRTVASTPYIVTKGIVLRETETKESDKILTLLTAEYGKISVIARGARRKSCKFAAAAQHLVWSEWTLYRRGEWYYANEGTTLELIAGLRADLDALDLGCYFAELTEAVTSEEVPAEELLRHLLNGLYALGTLRKPPMLVKAAFEMKLLCLAGYEPLVDSCAYCGRADPEQPLLDVVQGVLRCRRCGVKESTLSMPLCASSIPSRWEGKPWSGWLGRRRLSQRRSWSVDSERWISIRACSPQRCCPNKVQTVIFWRRYTIWSEI